VSERYAFIEVEKANHSVSILCRMLKVSRSGFYDWQRREPSMREQEDEEIILHMRTVHKEAKGRYGQRRMIEALKPQGVTLGRGRAGRLMRKAGLSVRRPRKFKATTDSKHGFLIADNVLARDFHTHATDTAWVGDITYIWTREGWLYLAVLIDLFSRRVVGWSMGAGINQELTLTALNMALGSRRPEAGLVHHTDRGSQYSAHAYRRAAEDAELTMSMSRKGDCLR
jgi:putative transposase